MRNGAQVSGVLITQIYAVQSEEYVIYQAGEVMVHFADDQSKEEAQRKAILPIGSARAEVNVLVPVATGYPRSPLLALLCSRLRARSSCGCCRSSGAVCQRAG